jgi:hypothetical protein
MSENNPQDETSCAVYYGPYPKCDPVPTFQKTDEDRESMYYTTDYRDIGTPDEWVTRDG